MNRFTVLTSLSMALAGALPTALNAKPAPAPDPIVPDVHVSATDLSGLLKVIQAAGVEGAKWIGPNGDGEKPMIEVSHEGLTSFILLRDCDEAVPDFCETLVLSTWWDRNTPISSDAVAQANVNFRYISVWPSKDGDPYAQWAIYTGREGIPAKVFLNALKRYQDVVYDFWDIAFDGDEVDQDEAADTDSPDASAQTAVSVEDKE